MRTIVVLIFLLLLGSTSLAAKMLADVEIVERVELPDTQQILLLNGAGIRSKMFFDIYVAALYLPEHLSDPARIQDPQLPKRLSMHFVYSEVSRKKMNAGWQSGFEDNSTKQQMSAMQPALDKFKSMFRDMKAGDVVLLDFLPAEGVQLSINQKFIGSIEGGDFSATLLRVWLGDEPVTDSLKRDLLGSN